MFIKKILTLIIVILAVLSLSTIKTQSQTFSDTSYNHSEIGIGGNSNLTVTEKISLSRYRINLLKYDSQLTNFKEFDINRKYVLSSIPKEKTLLIPMLKIFLR
jgi:hypothetical protein